MRIDALLLRMRPRAPLESADLGVRLCQHAVGSVYRCYAAVYLPIAALAAASGEVSVWLPTLVLFCAKPWLDRTVLFVLARAAFRQPTTLGDLWRERRHVWWQQWWVTWTWRRLSPWRSFTQPVFQLEGLPLTRLRPRLAQIKRRRRGVALMLTTAFATAETILALALASLLYWFAPVDQSADLLTAFFDDTSAFGEWVMFVGYAIVMGFLEPFYVAAGFGLYLNRRAELEAWDVEQELRRAFAT